MRWDGIDSIRDDDDEGEHALALLKEYNAHAAATAGATPPEIVTLRELHLHDGRVADIATTARALRLVIVHPNWDWDEIPYSATTLDYSDAAWDANDGDPIDALHLLTGTTEFMQHEVELLDDGAFRHGMLFHPTGELNVRFARLTLSTRAADAAEYRALWERPRGPRWGAESNAWISKLPPFAYAAATAEIPTLQRMLDDGADVNESDQHGITPLQMAMVRERPDVVEFLLDHRADPNLIPPGGVSSPASTAARSDDPRVLPLLLSRGARLDLDGNTCWQPILEAATGATENLRLLLSLGCDPNTADEMGWTALMYAAEGGPRESVQLLLDARADASRVYEGETAADMARRMGRPEIAELIERS